MISTEPGPDEVLEIRIRQALAGERFTVPAATITGRMSRHRRRTRVAVAAVAIGAAAAAAVPVLAAGRSERLPTIAPPVILPGPTGTTLDDACRSAGLVRLATDGVLLRPTERTELPPLRFASDLDGTRIYASNRVELVCRWSSTESRVIVETGWPESSAVSRMYGRDLDYSAATGPGRPGYIIGGVPTGVVAVEVELTDGRVLPARVNGDLFAAWWDSGPPGPGIASVTAIAPNAVYTRAGLERDPIGSPMTAAADPIGDACEQQSSYPDFPLAAASEAKGYRIYAGSGDRVVICVSTGDPADPVQLRYVDVPPSVAGVPVPTVATVVSEAGALGLILGRGDPTDVELQVNGIWLRPTIHEGFYAGAVPGTFTIGSVTRWVYVDPAVIYVGTGTTVTTVER